MYGCLTGAKYSMKADVYRQTKSQSETGQVVRSWSYEKTIDCFIARNITNSSSDNSETWGNVYVSGQNLILSTAEPLSDRDKITNVLDSNGKLLYSETNNDHNPTVFDILSTTSLVDGFGAFNGYIAYMSSSEVQGVSG